MTTTRTRIETELPISVGDAKAQTRVMHDDDDDSFAMFIRAAALDIEDSAALALLPTTVTHDTLPCPGRVIALPIGPALVDEDNAVLALAEDGTTAALTGWHIEAGTRPILHLAEAPEHRVRVTYLAQLAETPAELPDDIRHAIADQASRYFDQRGGVSDKGHPLSPHTARVIARYRGVRV